METKPKIEEAKPKRPSESDRTPKPKTEEEKVKSRKKSRFDSVSEENKEKDRRRKELDIFAEADTFGEQYDVSNYFIVVKSTFHSLLFSMSAVVF